MTSLLQQEQIDDIIDDHYDAAYDVPEWPQHLAANEADELRASYERRERYRAERRLEKQRARWRCRCICTTLLFIACIALGAGIAIVGGVLIKESNDERTQGYDEHAYCQLVRPTLPTNIINTTTTTNNNNNSAICAFFEVIIISSNTSTEVPKRRHACAVIALLAASGGLSSPPACGDVDLLLDRFYDDDDTDEYNDSATPEPKSEVTVITDNERVAAYFIELADSQELVKCAVPRTEHHLVDPQRCADAAVSASTAATLYRVRNDRFVLIGEHRRDLVAAIDATADSEERVGFAAISVGGAIVFVALAFAAIAFCDTCFSLLHAWLSAKVGHDSKQKDTILINAEKRRRRGASSSTSTTTTTTSREHMSISEGLRDQVALLAEEANRSNKIA